MYRDEQNTLYRSNKRNSVSVGLKKEKKNGIFNYYSINDDVANVQTGLVGRGCADRREGVGVVTSSEEAKQPA